MAHALLSASGASRWLACPPSARLEEHIKDKSSTYAEEGTLAHLFAENYLSEHFKLKDIKDIEKERYALKKSIYYDNSMIDYVSIYVDTVIEKYNSAKDRSKDAQIILEGRLDFSRWVPEGFGTGDAVIIADDTIEIIDLKYGQGKPVFAQDNPQLRLYAAGAIESFGFMYDIKKVTMTIVQPRLDSISSETVDVEDLMKWLDSFVKPTAELAFKGEGAFNAGKHCTFCKVKARCRARSEKMTEYIKYEFKHPDLLDISEIGSILSIAKELSSWSKDVEDYAFERLTEGTEVPGWKLVEGRSVRKITSEQEVIDILTQADDGKTENILKAPSLRGLTELEKYFGKKGLEALIGSYIEKPQGKDTMVPESDKRPALNSVDKDFENIEF